MQNRDAHPCGKRRQPIDFSVVEILLPRINVLDALAIETLLSSLDIESAFSLKISSDERGRRFLIRAQKIKSKTFKPDFVSI